MPGPVQGSSNAILVKLAARPDLQKFEAMPRGAERKTAVYNALVNTAAESQKSFVEIAEKLKQNGAITGYETLVSPNLLVLNPKSGKASEVSKAFQIAGVQAIYNNSSANTTWRPSTGEITKPDITSGPTWGLDVIGDPTQTEGTEAAPAKNAWGVDLVGAPEAWKQGATGKGLVYGSIDTGADSSHEALQAQYRGTSADGTQSHDYNWVGLSGKGAPNDPGRHGTHTIGSVLGKVGDVATGVAPEAKWIAAQGLDGAATPDGLLKALQWMQAPTKVDGSAPDPTKAPDVVGMSWWTGPNTEDFFQESMQDLRAAGIEVVKSAGNKGPGPGTISSPGQYKEVIATAAVDANSDVANFSSRGPSKFKDANGNFAPKPDFAAPGVDVLSTLPGNKYGTMSGTSMAQPHMSGAVLSVLSKYPQLTHDQLVDVLKAGVTDRGPAGHDAEYGYGVINLPATLAAAEKLVNTKPAAA